MSQFKVLVEFELDGAVQAVDSVVELSEEVSAPLVAEGKVEAVAPEATPEAAPESGESVPQGEATA